MQSCRLCLSYKRSLAGVLFHKRPCSCGLYEPIFHPFGCVILMCGYFCSGRRLAVAWTLAAVCLVGHSHHFLGHLGPSWLHMLHSTGFHAALSLAALVGPGRKLLVDGWKSFWRGSPNMNTLVGLGAVSSFAVSTAAALLPKLV